MPGRRTEGGGTGSESRPISLSDLVSSMLLGTSVAGVTLPPDPAGTLPCSGCFAAVVTAPPAPPLGPSPPPPLRPCGLSGGERPLPLPRMELRTLFMPERRLDRPDRRLPSTEDMPVLLAPIRTALGSYLASNAWGQSGRFVSRHHYGRCVCKQHYRRIQADYVPDLTNRCSVH